MERIAESELILNRHVFISIFGPENEEKVEKYSQSRYCSSTITYLEKVAAINWIPKHCRQKVDRVAEFEIVPYWHIFISSVGRAI